MNTFIVWGGNGWIGTKVVNLLLTQGNKVYVAKSRLENREDVEKEIEKYKPNRIINCAGKTGRPNIDWCESHQIETIRSNVTGALTLTDVAFLKNIHVTHFSSGCIYEHSKEHPEPWKEEDPPNFERSFYSQTKSILETLLKPYPNVLILRLRLPISDDIREPRNLVAKITKYEKVINVPNSVTVLSDLLPVSVDMVSKGLLGVYNFTNPGVITHNEILDLYIKYIDPNFVYQNFSVEEMEKILKAPRSNNELDVSKLLLAYPQIPHVKDSIIKVLERMKKKLEKGD